MKRNIRYRCKKSFRMEISTSMALEELADQTGMTVSELLRKMVERELRKSIQASHGYGLC
jgi:predicted DNA-binding protein